MKIYAICVEGSTIDGCPNFDHWVDNYKYFMTKEMAENWLKDEDNIKKLLEDNTHTYFVLANNTKAPFHYIYHAEDDYYTTIYAQPIYSEVGNAIVGWEGPDFEDQFYANEISFNIVEIEVEE